MSFRLDVDRLVKDELEFELQVRGINDPTLKVDDMRKCLRSCLALEKAGKVVHSVTALDPVKELTSCEGKLQDIQEVLSTFTGSVGQTKKVETKFAHIAGRLERVDSKEGEHVLKRSNLLKMLMDLISEYLGRSESFKQQKVLEEAPADPNFHVDADVSNLSLHDGAGVGSAPIQSTSGVGNLVYDSSMLPKSVPVYKWNLKFSGKSGESFNAFLEQVEDFCESRNVSKPQLFSSARDLFVDDALRVFNLYKSYALDWDSLVRLLKEEYVPRPDVLWKQIMARTQGENESVGLYVAVMTGLFNRMPTVVSNTLKMQVLLKNILPFYQERLTLVEVKTPLELIELGRKIEKTRENINSFKPPHSNLLTLEPDLSYSCKPSGSKPIVRNVTTREPRCWRCNMIGHIARNCSQSKVTFRCFGCGNVGFTRTTCPRCRSARERNNVENIKTPQSLSPSGNGTKRQ